MKNQGDPQKPLLILSMLMVLFAVLPIPLAFKISHIGNMVFSTASLIMPFFYTTADVIAEIYGIKKARFIATMAILLDIIFAIVCSTLILLPSPHNWNYQNYYDYVLGDSLRLSLSGTLALFISQFVNIHFLIKWKILLEGKYFWLRSIGASSIGEFIVSFITIFLAFSGKETFIEIIEITFVGYAIKLVVTTILSFPNTLLTNYLKSKFLLNLLIVEKHNPLAT